MKAVILAGGKGTRLLPYTVVYPKPMLPVGGMPVLEIIIKQLSYYGFSDITLSVGYLAELIQTYFSNKNIVPEGVNLSYVREDEPLGTAGSISLLPDMGESFLVMNGDVLTTLDYGKMLGYHNSNNADLTIAVYKKKIKLDVGLVKMNNNNEVIDYLEKPETEYPDSMGIYAYNPSVKEYIEEKIYLDLPTLVKKLISNGKKVIGYVQDVNYYWIDMGKHREYELANQQFIDKRKEFLPYENTPGI